MPNAPIASTSEFVALLQPLLSPTQREGLADLEAAFAEPKLLAKELVRRDWLTPFQVNQIFQGRAAELTLGPYVLLERLGQGGMGQVFKARHQVMNRIVALKVIRAERLGNVEAIARFRREIQSAAQVAHTHIVLAHDAGQVGDQHFLVMEYIEGVDLARLVKKTGPLPVAQACDYVRQAALGLQHAHERGLVHRDVKPSNLLVSADGVVKVLDLGLARPLLPQGGHDITRSGAVVGSPDYLAPEQARDAHDVDIRADIYSLGCTLYFLLAGRPPFPESSLTQKLLWHQHAEPTSLGVVRADLPAELIAIVQRMLAKDPAARLRTPAEVAAALTPFCQGARLLVPAPGSSAAESSGHSLTPMSQERGWTLAVSSADEPTPLSGASEHGWSLAVSESHAEPPRSAVTMDHVEPHRSLPAAQAAPTSRPPVFPPGPPPLPRSRRNLLLAGIGGATALIVAGVLLWGPWRKGAAEGQPTTPVAAAKKTNDDGKPSELDPQPKPEIKAKSKPETKGKIDIVEPEPDPPVVDPSEFKDPTDDPAKPWGEGPVRVNLTSKLGVTAKLAGDVSTDNTPLGPDYGYGSVFRDFVFYPKRERGTSGLGKSQTGYFTLLVDQGLILMIPLDQVKSATVKGKHHVLALRDGKEITGQPLISIKDSTSGKIYRFQDAKSVFIHQAPELTPAKPAATRYTATVGALSKRTFRLTQYHLYAYTGRFEHSISIHVAGEEVRANLSDFQSFTITPDEKSYKIRLLTPEGVESIGQYKSFAVFIGEATNRWLMLQFPKAGFTSLEVSKTPLRKTP